MAGLESFQSFESTPQALSAEAFEEFQARMAESAKQLQAVQKQEQKQKKKEDHLFKILLKFIKSNQNQDLVNLVSKLLSYNLPAAFILSLIIVNFPELQAEAGLKLLEWSSSAIDKQETLPDRYIGSATIPLKIKLKIDAWIQEISRLAEENAAKVLDHGLLLDQSVKQEIPQLFTVSMLQLLDNNQVDYHPTAIKKFAEFIISGIFKNLIEAKPKQLT